MIGCPQEHKGGAARLCDADLGGCAAGPAAACRFENPRVGGAAFSDQAAKKESLRFQASHPANLSVRLPSMQTMRIFEDACLLWGDLSRTMQRWSHQVQFSE